jgi:hypothetical protein
MKGNRLREQRNDSTSIVDVITGEIMTLIPSTKTAVMPPIEGRPGPEAMQPANALLANLTKLQDQPGSYRGAQMVNGRRVLQYQTEQMGAQWTILADAETQLPIEATCVVPLMHETSTMRDFVLDAELPDDLFSFTPPPGYTLRSPGEPGTTWVSTTPDGRQITHSVAPVRYETVTVKKGSEPDYSAPTEQDLVNYVRVLAEKNDGVFPAGEYATALGEFRGRAQFSPAARQQELDDPQLMHKRERAQAYLEDHASFQSTWYVGAGVKLGDATKAVFTWDPLNERASRVLFGDLSVKEFGEKDYGQLMLLSQTFTGKRDGRNPWAYYGVQVATAPHRAGCVVKQVAVGSPAAAAGVKPGDIITRVDNQPIAKFNDYARLVGSQKAGDTLAWTIRRGGDKLKVQITAAELPDQQPEWIESARPSE